MTTIREVINAILWRDLCEECFIVIEDRVHSYGLRRIDLCDIARVDKHYIYFHNGKFVPLHRVRKIVCRNEIVLER